MAKSYAFSNGGKAPHNHQKDEWIKEVGTYYYHSLILANFNVNLADEIFDNPADVIAKAIVSKQAYEHIEQK